MILNLVDQEKSFIKYKISKFPDGQQTIDLIDVLQSQILTKTVEIRSRLNDFKDLELIICANQALKNLGASHISLYVPYFVGARSDRKFQEGGVNYLKQVICPIVNSQNFDRVTVMDPHSPSLESCLNNFVEIKNDELVLFAINNIYNSDVVKV
jgi:ribose-phosphate pyrophosphokinase